MWKCENVRGLSFRTESAEADEARNLTESAAINVEIKHVEPIYLVPINGTRFLTSSASADSVRNDGPRPFSHFHIYHSSTFFILLHSSHLPYFRTKLIDL